MQNTLKVTLFWRLSSIFPLVSGLRGSTLSLTMSVIMEHKGFEKSNHWKKDIFPGRTAWVCLILAMVDDDHNYNFESIF